jgi:FkbM family methyltransferase
MDVETRDGLLWPVGDRMAYPTILGELAEIPVILGYCKTRRSCIQAGGNAGLWPRVLAPEFEMIYTFEPDRTLFHCLVNNVEDPNVVFLNAALGDKHKLVGLDRMYWPANVGAMQTTKEGRIPTLRIDDLGVTDCDLLQLDIEGAELFALQGAEETIKASKPVIVLELRRNGRSFGVFDQQIREHVLSLGYKFAEKLNFDEVFIPA